jgi:GNAT superfamily N-acetyltransferase
MKVRLLPRDEWWRLEHTGIPLLPATRPEDVDVVVVEHGNKVVACLTVLRVTHFEGAWVDPERRGLGATRALLRLATELARVRGDEWVMAGAEDGDERMTKVLGRLGAVKLPMEPYVLALGRA